MNSFGHLFRITSFGESHGNALGVVIDGCPAGIDFDLDYLKKCLERRRPGQIDVSGKVIVTKRNESDTAEVLSGVFKNKTLGTPIAIIVKNTNQNSSDYDEIKKTPRVGHADDVWLQKFKISDHRGGGRSSGRETVSRVMAGAVAEMLLKKLYPELNIFAYCSQIGELESNILVNNRAEVDSYAARFPRKENDIVKILEDTKKDGESLGATISLKIKKMPANIGEPVFYKLKAKLTESFMSIGATCGVEVGEAVTNIKKKGSSFHTDPENYGGIRGGISTGEDLSFKIYIKPTSSIMDVAKKGRHDPCIAIRVISVLEAMTAIVLADLALIQRNNFL